MKKFKWLVLVMCCVLGLSVFAACDGNNDGGDKTVKATGITLAPERALLVGQSSVLAAIIDPWDANAEVTWASSNKTVVSISTEGQDYGVAKVTALKAGEANITATVSGKTATCKITVEDPVFDVRIKGDYNGWGVTSLCAGELNLDNEFTKKFKVKYEGDQKDFGLYSTKPGVDEQIAWAREDVQVDFADVDGIEDGSNNWLISAGVYEFTVTLDTNGKFTAITVTSGATEDEATIVIPPVVKEFDMYFRGNWGGGDDWTNIRFGTAKFDKDNLTATADIELTAANFGVMPAVVGTETQAGWADSGVMSCAEGVTTITLPTPAGNATCTAAGTYNVTITMNAQFEIVSVVFNSFTPAAE